MEPEVEVIQFRPPGPATTLRLPLVMAPPDMGEPQVIRTAADSLFISHTTAVLYREPLQQNFSWEYFYLTNNLTQQVICSHMKSLLQFEVSSFQLVIRYRKEVHQENGIYQQHVLMYFSQLLHMDSITPRNNTLCQHGCYIEFLTII